MEQDYSLETQRKEIAEQKRGFHNIPGFMWYPVSASPGDLIHGGPTDGGIVTRNGVVYLTTGGGGYGFSLMSHGMGDYPYGHHVAAMGENGEWVPFTSAFISILRKQEARVLLRDYSRSLTDQQHTFRPVWTELTDETDFVADEALAKVRVLGGLVSVYAMGGGEYALLMRPDGPPTAPLMYGQRYRSYSAALSALATDVRWEENED